MRRLHLLVEGQTEEAVAADLIEPHLRSLGWIVSTSILVTKRPAGGGAFRGGVRSWTRIERELARLLRSNFDVVTTMLDYYGFPADAPGMATRPLSGPHDRVEHVELALTAAVA